MAELTITNEYTQFSIDTSAVNKLVTQIIEMLSLKVATLSIVFVENQQIQQLHQQFFNDNSPTDIITFPLNNPGEPIEADLVISLEMAQENAKYYGVSVEEEIKRLIIHGLLHLAGWKDESPDQQRAMRKKEDDLLKHVADIKLMIEKMGAS